jgi:hypothetical protein
MSKDDIDALAEEAGGAVRGVPISRIIATIAAQAATIELLRAECRAWREDNRMWIDDDYDTVREYSVDACIAATDDAKALEEP